MNLRNSMGKGKKREESDVNIIPVMNIFLLLIPFLLLTAAFVQIAILDLSLPSLSKGGQQKQQDDQKQLTLVILAVKETGFQLKSPGFKFDPINKIENRFDFNTLATQLRDVKLKNETAEDIIVSPEENIKYDIIIKVMDQCRESGFPNVSLAG
ncbi:biopolymer transporter ExbD [candidate division KSB1 bacterium]|nr:biopolymer transporter ExbD [candidate division KSB1 bacterium]